MPKRMVATSWLLLIGLAAVATAGVLQARAQPDSIGFISIDCGLPGTANSVAEDTKLSYAPDAAFTVDTGSSQNISVEYVTPTLPRRYLNVRSFPDGDRNCYTLRSLVAGLKYLLRAEFLYGNYDGLSRPPIFDLYAGVNFWSRVNVSTPDEVKRVEAILVVRDDYVDVCLVNTGSGTPFISVLELRPLKSSLYPQANATQGLVPFGRVNFGQTNATDIVRYPDDPRDRVWLPWFDATIWDVMSTTSRVENLNNDRFEAPSKVMQTAITPRNASAGNIKFVWDSKPQPGDPAPGYIAVMHFSELRRLSGNAVREFFIEVNGDVWVSSIGFRPDYLLSDASYSTAPMPAAARYTVNINATANSTLPPLINAIEVYSVISTTNVVTDSSDAIKAKYRVKKNWAGDPCGPKAFAWDGLSCSYALSSHSRITSVNISFSGLDGDISSSFANLKAVQYLDLSHNNLTGSIPDALSQLPSLTVLDLTNNQLSGSIPLGLLKRVQDGSLDLRYGSNLDICIDPESCKPPKRKSKLAIYIVVPVVLVVVIVLVIALLFLFLRRKKQGTTSRNNIVRPQNETAMRDDAPPPLPPGDVYTQSSLHLENRRFTYKELEMITNNFQHVLGRGGFGKVYNGFLEDGTQVAVKLRSQSSNQGVKEFLSEAQILTRIHHKNLVSMIGYCKDGQYMALVYEYMSEGTLQEQIAGNGRNGKRLTWRQRLRIAVDSAQGLEYLHKGCNPPLIHRDVKATNILLNAKLEARIADFGLSKVFNHDDEAQMSMNTLVGTPGYVDPAYQATMQPTTKSDVYSFGVVLLEMVAGRQAIISDPDPTSIIQWVRRRLARGNIEDVVDPRMRGEYDVNSVWKVADIALKCTAQAPVQRPTMTDVVVQLQECLELEEGHRARGDSRRGSFYTGSNNDLDLGYNAYTADSQSTDLSRASTAFEMEHKFGKVPEMDGGLVAR
ncbi:unnamed protein product [Urochloa decumbens]|uniref:non-specific serine/threonine protein kinase n=1 Tax=Urochloa decumbens TaxID=240449 RepID=A0ABC8VPJ2_9POAL